MNTYAYVTNNPINFFDPFGLFQFGTRRLSFLPEQSPLNNKSNQNLYHEHGFYDNGSNSGFSPKGIGPDDPAYANDYRRFGPFYDDDIMRQAEKNLRNSGNWDPSDYDFLGKKAGNGSNCQDYADALRDEYRRLGGFQCSGPPCSSPIPGAPVQRYQVPPYQAPSTQGYQYP